MLNRLALHSYYNMIEQNDLYDFKKIFIVIV